MRDKISHFEHVKAGTFNLQPHGLVFIGGEENLPYWDDPSPLLKRSQQ